MARTWEKGREDRVITKRYGVSFWGDRNVPKLTVVIVANICEYTKKHRIIYLKWVNSMVLWEGAIGHIMDRSPLPTLPLA